MAASRPRQNTSAQQHMKTDVFFHLCYGRSWIMNILNIRDLATGSLLIQLTFICFLSLSNVTFSHIHVRKCSKMYVSFVSPFKDFFLI